MHNQITMHNQSTIIVFRRICTHITGFSYLKVSRISLLCQIITYCDDGAIVINFPENN